MSLLARRFDLKGTLEQFRIPYTERGANVKRGNINVQCPWCGAADPSMHMGINDELAFACWRVKEHRGRNPVRLLRKLLGISFMQAKAMVGYTGEIEEDSFEKVANGTAFDRDGSSEQPRKPDHLDMPDMYRRVISGVRHKRAAFPYRSYLADRGISRATCRHFDLRYSLTGDMAGRVILPYYSQEGDVLTWTGRSIGHDELRYRALPDQDSVRSTKQTLYGLHLVTEGKILIIVEGPFDALAFYECATSLHCSVVAVSSASIEAEQVVLVRELAASFEAVAVCLDSGFQTQARQMIEEIRTPKLSPYLMELHSSCDDPGSAPPIHLRRALTRTLNKI